MSTVCKWATLALLACLATGCDSEPASDVIAPVASEAPAPQGTPPSAGSVAQDDSAPARGIEYDLRVFQPVTGDLPAMKERRLIRVLVPWSDTYYYLDGPQQRGIAFEAAKTFEKWLDEELDAETVKLHLVILPVRRDQMLDFIAEGRGDLALGGVTITEQRQELVDFTDPISKEIQELLVEGLNSEALAGIDDLSGREVHVRKSSSYWESLTDLSEEFEKRGLAPIKLVEADEYLSTEDLMQMANAGAIPYTVADSEIAAFWANALPDVRIRQDIAVRKGARYGWALRHDSPEFKALLNRFVATHKQGTLIANVIINRYLKDTSRLHNIHGEAEQQRMKEVRQYFETYAPQHDFDALMMLAQGFQESRLDQSMQSQRGAVGVMQLLPSTASDKAVGVDDISTAENNIKAGIRYMAWIRDTYFDDPALDDFNKTALAWASYNAGPNRVRDLRAHAAQRGLDPNRWFDNVEVLAAEKIGRETVDYVANIYKYYVAYRLSLQQREERG